MWHVALLLPGKTSLLLYILFSSSIDSMMPMVAGKKKSCTLYVQWTIHGSSNQTPVKSISAGKEQLQNAMGRHLDQVVIT